MKFLRILFSVTVAIIALEASFAQNELKEAPLRIAVYVDNGARSVGAFRWLELTACARDAVAVPVDGQAVRAGALDSADVLVMPGGSSVIEAKSLGAEGREKIRAFVKRGGGYVGTCAGCCLLMEPASHHPDMLHMIPFKFSTVGGKADMSIRFNRRAEELAGIKKGTQMIRYSEGPVPVPSIPVKDADVEVVATYDSDINPRSSKARTSMAGQAAAIAGTYGKGRLFVLSVHPEYDYADHYVLRGAFRFVTGRELAWDIPQRKRGQLAVGFVCDRSFGVETARLIQKLVKKDEFDVIPINKIFLEDGILRRLDAVIVPDGAGTAKPDAPLCGDNEVRTKAFLERGGRIIAYGNAAGVMKDRESGIVRVADADAALAALRAFAAEPLPKAVASVPKVERPIRAGIFHDRSNSNLPIASLLALAPEYELMILDPADYAAGALDGLDLVIQPGGSCASQYRALGEKGTKALRQFVLDGGKYYGVCAGAFLATQPFKATSRSELRLGLLPYRDDNSEHYRGKAPINLELTKDGKALFEGSAEKRSVYYAGGPALVDGEPVEDSDVKVFARYYGNTLNTMNPAPVKPMAGKAAIVGGRVGKGKVFITCPHPEKQESTFDLVLGGIKFLTGVAPTPRYREKSRGAVVVRYVLSDKASAEQLLLGKFGRDDRFHLLTGRKFDDLSHVDAVVLTDKVTRKDMEALGLYISRGLKVVAVADTEAEREAAKKFPAAIVVDSYDKLPDALLSR